MLKIVGLRWGVMNTCKAALIHPGTGPAGVLHHSVYDKVLLVDIVGNPSDASS
jgi:hypothetical protein